MTFDDVKQAIQMQAAKHAAEADSELAYYFELEAYETIAQWLLQENIPTGSFALQELLDASSDLYDDRFDYFCDLQLACISENPPFPIAPEMKELFFIYQQAFWPEME